MRLKGLTVSVARIRRWCIEFSRQGTRVFRFGSRRSPWLRHRLSGWPAFRRGLEPYRADGEAASVSDEGRADLSAGAEVSPEVAKLADKIEQVEPRDAIREMVIGFASRQTIGPDPQTAAVLAETERHAEETRLQAYKESLLTRDRQSERDHVFRLHKLRNETWNVRIVLGIALLRGATGVWLLAVRGQSTLGSNFLIFAGGLIYMALSGKNPFEKQ